MELLGPHSQNPHFVFKICSGGPQQDGHPRFLVRYIGHLATLAPHLDGHRLLVPSLAQC